VSNRIILDDRDARADQMPDDVRAVAESILDDHRGDEIIANYLTQMRHVHRYSIGNRILIGWQAPDSRLVASRPPFDRMAREQGHEPRSVGRSTSAARIRSGSKAVWIWVPRRATRTEEDPQTGEEVEVPYTFFRPGPLYRIEQMIHADDGQPMETPDWVAPIDHAGLHSTLLRFADARGIEVEETALGGPRGVSQIETILLQSGDDEALQLAPLLHEIGHEPLHGVTERIELPGRILEGEAEAFAAVVLRHLGHEVPISAAYLRHHGVTRDDVIASMDGSRGPRVR